MSSNAIILSIRPKYAEKILEGTKTVELRRIRPKHIKQGTVVFVYASSPVKSLIGAFKVDRIIEKPLKPLWNLIKGRASVSTDEFNAYFDGSSSGVAIFFEEFFSFSNPLKLEDLRDTLNFRPPQSFRYANIVEMNSHHFINLMRNAEDIS